MAVKLYSWKEIELQNKPDSRWIVIHNKVYNITHWLRKHPGGTRVLYHYSGQDATEAFTALHHDHERVRKYLKPLYIGDVDTSPDNLPAVYVERNNVMVDFEMLRIKLLNLGLFKSNILFFFGMLLHIIVLEMLSYLNLWYFGASPMHILLSIVIYATAQSQASWLQHDFGHQSVFKHTKLDHFFHELTMGFIKGASSHWWKHMHNQHHVKPNVIDKDPDVRLYPVFVVGDTIPVQVGKMENPPKMPYNQQHKYFFAIGPPLLFPIYFQIMSFRHMFTRRQYEDLFWVGAYWAKLMYLYYPILGLTGSLLFYFIVRMAESHWFTWVSQSNHLPMPIESDDSEPWLALQIHATCDIEQSLFNDWFTGHLNFQIEHHLFPTMPRHNYAKAQPYVRELCKKYDIPYVVKPLGTAFVDIIRCLRKSGQLWAAVYDAHHM